MGTTKSNDHFMIGSTSLPPKNDGQLRGHVELKIPFIKWLGKRSNRKVYVTVLWWGEEGIGTTFRPANSEAQKVSNKFICAMYGMISGPKRFTKYLKDMKVMQLSIHNENDYSLVGHAQVKNLSSLSFSNPISSMCPVVNKQNKKIAEIKVEISIKYLQSRGEGANDVPTPDGGLNPVGNSGLYLDDLKSNRNAFEEKSLTRNDNFNPDVGDYYQELKSTDSNEGVVDSIVNSLERLRSEMMSSCFGVDVFGIETDSNVFLANTAGMTTQPADLILNSILGDGGCFDLGDSDNKRLLEHSELYDIFYKNVPNSIENDEQLNAGDKKKIEKSSGHRNPLQRSPTMENINLHPKLKKELSEISGILLLINNFTLTTTRQSAKNSKDEKGVSSDCMLSVYISRSYHDQPERLVEIRPLLIKMKGKVLQFNQRIVISNELLNFNEEDNTQATLLFKLSQGTTRMKAMCSGEFNILELLLAREEVKVLKLELKDKTGGSVGLLEISLKLLFGGREKSGYRDSSPKSKPMKVNEVGKKSDNAANDGDELSYLKGIPLYIWLVIPHGDIFIANAKLKDYESVSLIVRSHWSESAKVKVKLMEGRERVSFNLFQTHPLSLTGSLLNAMKDNYVVMETWAVSSSNKKKELLGISKVSINSFFQSFNSKDSFQSTTKSTFPVVAMDGNIPVVCPVSGNSGGLLQVLVAMGTYDQILHLQDFKMKAFPEFFHESIQRASPTVVRSELMKPQTQIEHMLEMNVESLKILSLPEEINYGGSVDDDLECYVQFVFPDFQDGCRMRQHQTSSANCDRNVDLHESFKQIFVLPDNVPLTWHICKAYSTNQLPNEIVFQLWLKSRTIPDCLVAKGSLALNKFFGCIDSKIPGQSQGSSEFAIDMSSIHMGGVICGALKVQAYHSSSISKDSTTILKNPSSTQHASLSVHISRACGLKYACQMLQDMRHQTKMNSLNTFIKVSLFFLDQINTKTTRVVTKSFTPDFNTHFEFLCPLTTWNNSSSLVEKYSRLIAIFEKARLEIDVYSTNGEKAEDINSSNSRNLLIGKVKISLSSLITKRTGLRGWHQIESPREQTNVSRDGSIERHVGGIEVGVRFSTHEDLESILEVGRMDGRMNKWSSKYGTQPVIRKIVQLNVDNLSFPPQILSSDDITPVLSTAKCYITYKFFDRSTVFSELYPISLWDGRIYVDVNHTKDFHVDLSSTFDWYLSEEKLEIQVWMTFGESGSVVEPRADNEFVGSGYIDLVQLSDFDGKMFIKSGYCPLFNETSDYLGSSAIHYNLQISKQHQESSTAKNDEEEKLLENVSEEDHFLARVVVDRAYHLPILLEDGLQILPNAYVTFESSNSFEVTKAMEGDCDPVWSFESNVWLHRRLLSSDNMKFKVWHAVNGASRDKNVDKCFGFATVDLTPLATEKFQAISGFYNISDYDGSQQGQIKVSITPLQKISAHGQLKTAIGEFKDGAGDHVIINSDEVTKNITDALEELTNKLKHKISQSYDIQSFPAAAQELHLEDFSPYVERSLTPKKDDEFSSHDDLEGHQSASSNSLHIFVQNYNHEPCECDEESYNVQDFEDHFDSTPRTQISDVQINVPYVIQTDFAAQGDHGTINNSFIEKYAQTEQPSSKKEEIIQTDLFFSNSDAVEEGRLESPRSSHSFLTSDSEKKSILTGDWLSEHKRKVSQRIVAFKSFKVPSVQQSERIARILANKFKGS